MKNEKTLFTNETKPRSISGTNIFISLIAEDILQLRESCYQGEYTEVPAKHAKDYLIFTDNYWSTLETCLRDFDKMSKEKFTEKYRKNELKESEKALEGIVEDTIDYIFDKIGGHQNSIPIDIDKNKHVDPLLKKKLEQKYARQIIADATVVESEPGHEKEPEKGKKADNKKEDENDEPKIIDVIELPETTIQGIKRSIRKIAEESLIQDAFEIIEYRVLKDGEYRFKKFVHKISDIYDDFILNPTSGKPKKSLLEKDDTTLIKQAANNYEVIGKRKYLKNKRKFESALRGSFLEQVKSAREVLKKEG